MSKEEGTLALRKGLTILQLFNYKRTTLSLMEIARTLSLPPSTVSRILNALEETGFIERDQRSKLYSLGIECDRLGILARASGTLKRVALPLMEQIRDQYGETINLFVRRGKYRVCYAQAETEQPYRLFASIGEHLPLWAGAAGRCFLAYMPEDKVNAVLDEITPLTSKTILDRATHWEMIKKIKEQGYGLSYAERVEGLYAIAVPIMEAPGSAVASLSLSAPSIRFSEEKIRLLIAPMQKTAETISHALYS